MTAAGDIFSELMTQDRITAQDVIRVRSVIFPDMAVSPEEAEALFALNDHAKSTALEWRQLFVEALTDYVVRQQHPPGYVDDAKADWLVARLARDGRVKSDTELELLTHVIEVADQVPSKLTDLALLQVATFAMSPERRAGQGQALTAEEVARVRRVIYACAGDGGGVAITRREAEVIFALNNASRGQDNHPSWRDLYVHAIGSAILNGMTYDRPSRSDALRHEDWLETPAEGVMSFLGKMGEALRAGTPKAEPDVFDLHNRKTDAALAAASVLTEDEAAWLTAQIGRDRRLDDNERALLQFVAEEASSVHPALRPLIADAQGASEAVFGRRGAGAR